MKEGGSSLRTPRQKPPCGPAAGFNQRSEFGTGGAPATSGAGGRVHVSLTFYGSNKVHGCDFPRHPSGIASALIGLMRVTTRLKRVHVTLVM